jgi:hypothetical protein
MSRPHRRRYLFLGLLTFVGLWTVPGIGQNRPAAPAAAPVGEWRAYGAVEGSTR